MSKAIFRFLLLFLLLGSSLSAYSQNFREGFIIKTNGDTTLGLINFRRQNNAQVHFKRTSKALNHTYRAGEITAFGYKNGRFYTSESFDLSNGQEISFYDNLIVGELSLYRTGNFFIIKKGSKTSKIHKINRSVSLEEQASQKRENTKTASAFLTDCNRSLIEEFGLEASERSLTQIIRAYHKCTGSDFEEYNNDYNWVRFDLSVFAGLTNSRIKFDDNIDFDFVDQLRFDAINSVFFGSEVSFTFPRINDNVRIILGLHYQKTDFHGYTLESKGFIRIHDDLIFRTSFARIPMGLGYQFRARSIPINLKAGGQFNLMLNYSQLWLRSTVSTQPDQSSLITTIEYHDEFKNNLITGGFWFGIGTEKRISDQLKLTFDLRLETNSSLTSLSSNTRNLQFLIGLKL